VRRDPFLAPPSVSESPFLLSSTGLDSCPKATITRRVIYPWYTAIQPDHETFEMPGQLTWSAVSACHCDMEAPKYGVAGDVVTQDRPHYRFPAAVKFDSVSPLSDALVGRWRWMDHEVLQERDILLGDDVLAATALLTDIRARHVCRLEPQIYHSSGYCVLIGSPIRTPAFRSRSTFHSSKRYANDRL
jgi:hypothetical protein